jgi:hypothetical protein
VSMAHASSIDYVSQSFAMTEDVPGAITAPTHAGHYLLMVIIVASFVAAPSALPFIVAGSGGAKRVTEIQTKLNLRQRFALSNLVHSTCPRETPAVAQEHARGGPALVRSLLRVVHAHCEVSASWACSPHDIFIASYGGRNIHWSALQLAPAGVRTARY